MLPLLVVYTRINVVNLQWWCFFVFILQVYNLPKRLLTDYFTWSVVYIYVRINVYLQGIRDEVSHIFSHCTEIKTIVHAESGERSELVNWWIGGGVVLGDQPSIFVICNPRNLVLMMPSTTVLLMSGAWLGSGLKSTMISTPWFIFIIKSLWCGGTYQIWIVCANLQSYLNGQEIRIICTFHLWALW